MNEIQKRMIDRARKQYKQIKPCGDNNNLYECFTIEGNLVFFWFNTPDKSTHVLTEKLS